MLLRVNSGGGCLRERRKEWLRSTVMNFDSPMMGRVQRAGKPGRFPALPRKGRIRIVLMCIGLVILIRFVPSMVHNVHLPKFASTHANSKKDGKTAKEKKDLSRPKTAPLSDIAAVVRGQPGFFSTSRAIVMDGRDSLAVHTSIDTSLTAYIVKLMRRYHPLYGALVALDPVSGRIYAFVSYTGDSMPDLGGNLCLRSIFPAASVFKTVTAAAAIERKGYTADCRVEHRGRMSTLYRSQIVQIIGDGVEMSLSQAYARSVNGVFGRIGIFVVGDEALLEMSTSMGFNRTIPGEITCDISNVYSPESDYNLAEIASGFNQKTTMSPLLGALVAAAISGNGVMPVPTLVDSVVRVKDGALKYAAKPTSWRRAVAETTANELRTMMGAVVKYGTASKHFRDIKNSKRFAEIYCGGKTGSVDKDGVGRVDWFIGFAAHPHHADERIAIGAVTAHGAYWTVHSSYLAAETMRVYLRTLQERKKLVVAEASAASVNDARSSPEPVQ